MADNMVPMANPKWTLDDAEQAIEEGRLLPVDDAAPLLSMKVSVLRSSATQYRFAIETVKFGGSIWFDSTTFPAIRERIVATRAMEGRSQPIDEVQAAAKRRAWNLSEFARIKAKETRRIAEIAADRERPVSLVTAARYFGMTVRRFLQPDIQEKTGLTPIVGSPTVTYRTGDVLDAIKQWRSE